MLFGNISYDVGAILILLVIMVWFALEKRAPIRSYGAYFVLVLMVFCASCFEIVTELTAKQGYDSFLFLLSLSMMILFLHTITLALLWFTETLANFQVSRLYYIVVESITVITCVINPFTRCSIDYSAQGYIFHWGSNLMFFFDIINVVGCMILVSKLRKEIPILRFIVLIFSIALCWVGLFIQVFWYQNLMVFLMSLTCLSLYRYQLNPTAMTDSFTGLFNRKFLSPYIQNQFMQGKTFEVVVIAMDDFRFINRTYGVSTGDELIRMMGEYIKGNNKDRLAFRMGSDQFCVILKKEKDLISFIENMECRLKESWNTEMYSGIMLSATTCCISCPKDAPTYEELLDIIDYSIEYSKANNKGQICHVDNVKLNKLREKKEIASVIKQAVEQNEIMVYYQPIYSIEKGCYNSAEALVRLYSDRFGWISPEVFIPIAEKNGLINRLGEMILEKTCQFIRDYNIENSVVEYIEVNISTVQIAREDFVKQVKEILERYHVKPCRINMEITETATIHSHKTIRDNISQLVEYGINFSLDDYGSGNANIGYINQFPFSVIKLDKEIIWDSFESEKAKITLEYTVAMVKALDLQIVAEGVENEKMKEQLSNMGCDFMQGWYYSKAVPGDEFAQMISGDYRIEEENAFCTGKRNSFKQ